MKSVLCQMTDGKYVIWCCHRHHVRIVVSKVHARNVGEMIKEKKLHSLCSRLNWEVKKNISFQIIFHFVLATNEFLNRETKKYRNNIWYRQCYQQSIYEKNAQQILWKRKHAHTRLSSAYTTKKHGFTFLSLYVNIVWVSDAHIRELS